MRPDVLPKPSYPMVFFVFDAGPVRVWVVLFTSKTLFETFLTGPVASTTCHYLIVRVIMGFSFESQSAETKIKAQPNSSSPAPCPFNGVRDNAPRVNAT